MADTFDAAATALAIERTAKIAVDNQRDHNHPIEADMVHSQAADHLRELFGGLKDNEQLRQVGIELEKLGNDPWSTLPNVKIDLFQGQIKSIVFSPSFWDFHSNSDFALESVNF